MQDVRLFDTHCHLTDERFAPDLADVLVRMRHSGIALALLIADAGLDPMPAMRLAQEHDFLYTACGVHPHDASSWTGAKAALVTRYLAMPKCVALGEIGLDYHYNFSPKTQQLQAFDEQLTLAHELQKPAILHVREAHGEALELLTARHRQGTLPQCVMHCYTGSWESAKTYLSMGMYISLSGAITFKNAPKLTEVAQNCPLDRLLIETDSPYMAPVPLRGQRNEPAFVRHVAERVALIRQIPLPEFAQATLQNGVRVFGLPDPAGEQ